MKKLYYFCAVFMIFAMSYCFAATYNAPDQEYSIKTLKIADSGTFAMSGGVGSVQKFVKTYANTPKVMMTWQGAASTLGILYAGTVTKTQFTPRSGTASAKGNVAYMIFGD